MGENDMNNNITALVVDDSKSMRQVISLTLKHAGYNTIEASDGEEALEIAKSQNFDIVLTDINMPIMDGVTLIEQLRTLPEYKSTPILTITTESADVKKHAGKEAGATGWIVKPIDQDKLLAVMDKLLH